MKTEVIISKEFCSAHDAGLTKHVGLIFDVDVNTVFMLCNPCVDSVGIVVR